MGSHEEVKERIRVLKIGLKDPSTFTESCETLSSMIPSLLSHPVQKAFYDAVTMVNNRIFLPNFDATSARKVIDYAYQNRHHFTKGYMAHVERWKSEMNMILDDNKIDTVIDNNNDDVFLDEEILSHIESSIACGSPYLEDYEDEIASAPLRYKQSDIPFRRMQNKYPLPSFKLPHITNPEDFNFKFEILELKNTEVWLCIKSSDNSYFLELKTASLFVNDLPVVEFDPLYGYNITSLCRTGDNIFVIKAKSCCCTYEIEIQLCSVVCIDELVDIVLRRDRSDYTDVKVGAVSDQDVSVLSAVSSNIDPISQDEIEIPCRGLRCEHAQCFDLKSFLEMNSRIYKFLCPVCSEVALFDDLRVSSKYKKRKELEDQNEVPLKKR
ncbi:zinc finger MIZ domain-containing protein [Acrasis kona]|uniref:Zinc finger MIZ domain-containing protein n=1 Tax=Acrasis kona TaxID=1008807 RepID=A0AAW2ZGX6_9EUKA